MSDWVKLSDRKPKEGEDVLLLLVRSFRNHRRFKFTVAHLWLYEGEERWSPNFRSDYIPEYWLPLPDLPGDEAQNIRHLELGTRAHKCLLSHNIDTVDKLVDKTPGQLLKIPGLGRKALLDIEKTLEMFGMHLKA